MALTHRSLLALVALLAAGAAVAIAVLWPSFEQVHQQVASSTPDRTLIDATIVDVEPVGAVDQPGLAPDARSVVLTARRADNGETVIFAVVDETGDLYQAGDRVRLERFESPTEGGRPTYGVADFRRGPALIALAGLFVLAVLAFSRWQGLRALLGLGLTFAVILGFVIPALLSGHRPLIVALAGSVAIVIATLYLSHGAEPSTTAAVVGTAGALAVTVALGAWFVDLASLTGLAEEEARLANVQVGGISLRGLLLAGIIVGTLGVLDDVTVTQSSTVFALGRADPGASYRRLVAEALRVGRDHVAATVNTLFLAYAGASLPLLILFVTGPVAVDRVITGEIVAVEVVRTLVGSLGLIAAVPLTTLLAAALAHAQAAPTRPAADRGPEAGGFGGPQPGATPEDPVGAALASPGAGRAGGAGDGGKGPDHDTGSEPRGRQAGDGDEPGEADGGEPEDWEQRLRRSYGLDDGSQG